MSATYIENALVVRPGIGVKRGSVLLAEGKISAFDPPPESLPDSCERVCADGCLLTPGLIDVHTHGIHEHLFERSPEDLIAGTELLPRYGTTSVLPTLYRVLNRPSLNMLEKLAVALDAIDGVSVPGFHLEGPFLALPGAGAATTPGDLVLLDELLSATRGRTRAMSISPDCPNILPVIERLCSDGIAVFITHTRATVAETESAICAGARHATHFYDVFPAPAESDAGVRPVGAVEVLLGDKDCSVDFICDGVHVHPAAIRLAVLAKGWSGVVAITDSNIGAGLKEGIYPTPWGFPVRVRRDDAARVHDPEHPLHGQLAGSSLTMNRALANLLAWLDVPGCEVWGMGTCNPARLVNLGDKGVMQVDADADLVLWSGERSGLEAVRTWVGGACVYEREPVHA